MSGSRRDFLAQGTLGLLGVAVAAHAQTPQSQEPTPGAPPAFGTAPPVGPEVSAATFAEAEKLVQVEMTPADRAEAAENWRMQMAPLYERRTGPRKLAIEESVAPATLWNPMLPGMKGYPAANAFVRSAVRAAALPGNEEDIAFATVTQLSRWIEGRQITSERLTEIYISRMERFDPKLRCVITLAKDHALEQARQADKEIAAGRYRGPLHGIPWGGKDLLDTAGIRDDLGRGALQGSHPDEGCGGCSPAECGRSGAGRQAEPGRAGAERYLVRRADDESVAAGGRLVGIERRAGSGDGGGAGRVRDRQRDGREHREPVDAVRSHGAASDVWACAAHGSDDAVLVARQAGADGARRRRHDAGPAMRSTGPDSGDLCSVPSKLDFDAGASVAGLRVGYFPAWMKDAPATDVDRAALETVKKLGMVPVAVSLPDWPYDSLNLILFAEGAAAFEELTLSHQVDELKAQVPDAWPNCFRQSRFLSAVDFVQADRMRRKVAQEMARIFSEVDLLLVPSLRDEMLVISNNHRASLADAAGGICRGVGGAQRLGSGPEASAAEVFSAAAGAAWGHADRAAL